jgi:hypothetical protein
VTRVVHVGREKPTQQDGVEDLKRGEEKRIIGSEILLIKYYWRQALIIVLCKSLPNSLAADAGLLSHTPTFRRVHQHSTINATATPHLHLKGYKLLRDDLLTGGGVGGVFCRGGTAGASCATFLEARLRGITRETTDSSESIEYGYDV